MPQTPLKFLNILLIITTIICSYLKWKAFPIWPKTECASQIASTTSEQNNSIQRLHSARTTLEWCRLRHSTSVGTVLLQWCNLLLVIGISHVYLGVSALLEQVFVLDSDETLDHLTIEISLPLSWHLLPLDGQLCASYSVWTDVSEKAHKLSK